MVVTYSVRSHGGYVRETNEDNFCANGELLPPQADQRGFSLDGRTQIPCLFAVCDGMGGTDNGELASLYVARTLAQYREQLIAARGAKLNALVAEAVKEADTAIRRQGQAEENAGTTMSAAVITRRGISCFHLGDSRIYHLDRGGFVQVTRDHTWIAEHMEKERPLSPEMVMENMHKITRCVGVGPSCVPENYDTVKPRGRLLLCTDGLTDMLSEDEINSIMSENKDTANTADMLLSLSLKKGGYDNITIILADFKKKYGQFRNLKQKTIGAMLR